MTQQQQKMEKSATFSIEDLKSYREGKRLEVKSAKGGLPNSLWETYSAFANSDGGVIVLGVKEREDGSLLIEGLKDAHKLLKDFWNMVNNRQKVSSNILTDSMVKIEECEGKDVIVIRVPRAERTTRPVYVGCDPRSGSYRRNGEGDYHCSLDEVSLMIRDSSLVSDDSTLLTQLDYSVFCPDTIRAYRNIFNLTHQNHLWNQEDDMMFMRRIGAMREDKETGKFCPTGAGLLMFGYEYEISAVYPNYFLDYQENRTNGINARWTDRITCQTGDWSGNVFDFLLKVIPKLQADLKVPFVLKGNLRQDDTPVHKAVREAMINMVTNADFHGRRGVVVNKDAEGFKFANPGTMRVSLSDAIQDNSSDPRNGTMLKMLAMVEYGERAGSGLHRIFHTWETVYHCKPTMETTASGGVDRTILRLSFEGHQPDTEAMRRLYNDPEAITFGELGTQESTPESKRKGENTQENGGGTQESTTDKGKNTQETPASTQEIQLSTQENMQEKVLSTQEKILSLLRTNPSLTLAEVASRLGITRDGVKKAADKMRADGRLVREGSTKAGHWIVKE